MSESSAAPSREGRRLTPQSLSQEHDSWLEVVELSGEEGRDWAEQFRRPDCARAVRTAVSSLGLLQRQRFAEGHALLAEAEAALEATRGSEPSVVLAMESIFYPLRAYYHYCVEAWDDAMRDLDRADTSVAGAIAHRRFLVPLAYRCSELTLHRARIARNRRQWNEMHRQIARAWDMMEGRHPLCVLADGTGVTIAELVAFFRSLPPLEADVEEYLRGLTDEVLRRSLFERFVNRIYALPGLVILYP